MQGRLLTFSLFIQNSSLWQKLCRTSWTCHLSSSSTTVNSLWKVWDSLVDARPSVTYMWLSQDPHTTLQSQLYEHFLPTPLTEGLLAAVGRQAFAVKSSGQGAALDDAHLLLDGIGALSVEPAGMEAMTCVQGVL